MNTNSSRAHRYSSNPITEKQGNTMTFFAEDLGFPNDFVIVQTSI